ncbi:PspC domain-containing protein [Parasphingopyxis algicola]|uniref:PspC domain-containing protein n=1 Tax=Parasphingopyxis algicola TaxID=2026624 RepID=UPI0015A2ADD2|nr:PspC domain-containing protein [Parasphingopyxis algicola]QLC26609.1 PspC domain-containing protein [Parasphingopyxis algicola]
MGYRYERNAVVKQERRVLGVCAAIGNSLGVRALWVRIATVALTIFVTAWIIPAYLIAGWALHRAKANRRAHYASEARYIGTERRYLSESSRLLAHRDSALSREIDALR